MSVSDAKLEANRLNALKSTGPRTVDGKNKSRANSMTHGLCNKVIDIPGQDAEAIAEREEAWQVELNPSQKMVQGYIVQNAVRHTLQLDRLDDAYHYGFAESARNARQTTWDSRLTQIEQCERLLLTDEDTAARRLKATSYGCQFLLDRWADVKLALIEPPQWYEKIMEGANRLRGRHACRVVSIPTPTPWWIETQAIDEYRQVLNKVQLNADVDTCPFDMLYRTPYGRKDDIARLPELKAKSEAGLATIRRDIDIEVAEITAMKAEHDAHEHIIPKLVLQKATFDASDRGKLIHRYQLDHERALFRCLKELGELNKMQKIQPQDMTNQQVAESLLPRTLYPPPPRPARNEPTARRAHPMFDGLKVQPKSDSSYINVSATPQTGPKKQQ